MIPAIPTPSAGSTCILPDPSPVLSAAAAPDVRSELVLGAAEVPELEAVIVAEAVLAFAGPAVMTTGSKGGYSVPLRVTVVVGESNPSKSSLPEIVAVQTAWVVLWSWQLAVCALL